VSQMEPSASRDSVDQEMASMYDELRRLVAKHMRLKERPNHTLCPTDVVHEAYLKLAEQKTAVKGTGNLRALVVKAVRNILVDYARARSSQKRGGDRERETLVDVHGMYQGCSIDVLDLHLALEKLAQKRPRQARVSELKLFGEMDLLEIAEVIGISRNTVSEDWAFSRAWLMRELNLKGSPHADSTG